MLKRCGKCGEAKELDQFYKDPSKHDGYNRRCKSCFGLYKKARRAVRGEAIKERDANYRALHRERIAERERTRHRTWAGFATSTFKSLQARTINGTRPQWDNPRCSQHYLSKGVELRMTKEEYKDWCEQRKDAIEEMQREGLRPSLDRIDSDLHYSLDNIRVIPFITNCRIAGRLGGLSNARHPKDQNQT